MRKSSGWMVGVGRYFAVCAKLVRFFRVLGTVDVVWLRLLLGSRIATGHRRCWIKIDTASDEESLLSCIDEGATERVLMMMVMMKLSGDSMEIG